MKKIDGFTIMTIMLMAFIFLFVGLAVLLPIVTAKGESLPVPAPVPTEEVVASPSESVPNPKATPLILPITITNNGDSSIITVMMEPGTYGEFSLTIDPVPQISYVELDEMVTTTAEEDADKARTDWLNPQTGGAMFIETDGTAKFQLEAPDDLPKGTYEYIYQIGTSYIIIKTIIY